VINVHDQPDRANRDPSVGRLKSRDMLLVRGHTRSLADRGFIEAVCYRSGPPQMTYSVEILLLLTTLFEILFQPLMITSWLVTFVSLSLHLIALTKQSSGDNQTAGRFLYIIWARSCRAISSSRVIYPKESRYSVSVALLSTSCPHSRASYLQCTGPFSPGDTRLGGSPLRRLCISPLGTPQRLLWRHAQLPLHAASAGRHLQTLRAKQKPAVGEP
jgi:hypothetical protein